MKDRTTAPRYPTVIGDPGGALVGATWAKNAEVAAVGRAGELKTGELLGRIMRNGGPTVIHDVMVPPAYRANVDHIVVSGRQVTLIDSKNWRSGRYWTLRGHTRRGTEPVPHVDKPTMGRSRDDIARFLDRAEVDAKVTEPVFVCWPSSRNGRLGLAWYRPPVGIAMTGHRATRRLARRCGSKPADQAVVAALIPLVVSVRSGVAVVPVAPISVQPPSVQPAGLPLGVPGHALSGSPQANPAPGDVPPLVDPLAGWPVIGSDPYSSGPA